MRHDEHTRLQTHVECGSSVCAQSQQRPFEAGLRTVILKVDVDLVRLHQRCDYRSFPLLDSTKKREILLCRVVTALAAVHGCLAENTATTSKLCSLASGPSPSEPRGGNTRAACGCAAHCSRLSGYCSLEIGGRPFFWKLVFVANVLAAAARRLSLDSAARSCRGPP